MARSIRSTILSLLAERDAGKTICPSEVARTLWPTGWRTHMQNVRAAALRMAEAGEIDITQHGRKAPGSARGAIRLRLR